MHHFRTNLNLQNSACDNLFANCPDLPTRSFLRSISTFLLALSIMAIAALPCRASSDAAATDKEQIKTQQKKAQQWLDIAATQNKKNLYAAAKDSLDQCSLLQEFLSSGQQKKLGDLMENALTGIDAQDTALAALDRGQKALQDNQLAQARQEFDQVSSLKNYLDSDTIQALNQANSQLRESLEQKKAAMKRVFQQSVEFFKQGSLDQAEMGFQQVQQSGVDLNLVDRGLDLNAAENYLEKINALRQNQLAQASQQTPVQQPPAERPIVQPISPAPAPVVEPQQNTYQQELAAVETTPPANADPEPIQEQITQPAPAPSSDNIESKSSKFELPFFGRKKLSPQLQKQLDTEIARGDLAITKGNYQQAKLFYQNALNLNSDSEKANLGLAAADYHLTQKTPAPPAETLSILDRVKQKQMLQIQAIQSMWTSTQQRVNLLKQNGRFEQAIAEVTQALATIDGSKQVLGNENYQTMQNQAKALLAQLSQEQNLSKQTELETKIAEAEQRENQRQKKTEAERTQKIHELFDLAQKFKDSREFAQAVATLDRLLELDPRNKYAGWLREDMQDMLFYEQQKNIYNTARTEEERTLLDARESATPWLQRYRFPEDWEELSERRYVPADPKNLKKIDAQEKLKLLIDMDHDDEALRDVIEEVRSITGLNIVVQWNELELAFISAEDPITIQLSQVGAGKALDRLLAYASGGKQGRAGYVLDEEGIVTIKLVPQDYGYFLITHYIADLVEVQSGMGMGGGGGGGGGSRGGGGGSSRGGGGSSSRGGGGSSRRSSLDRTDQNNFFASLDSEPITPAFGVDLPEENSGSYPNDQQLASQQPRFWEVRSGGGSSRGGGGGRSGGGRSGGGGSSRGGGGGSGGMGGNDNYYEQEELMYLIQSTIKPESWSWSSMSGGGGGSGGRRGGGGQRSSRSSSSRTGALGGAAGALGIDEEGIGELSIYKGTTLAVYQTADVHQQIKELLKKLRETQGDQVAIEARLLTISSNFLEDIGLDIDFLINMDNAGFDKFSDITIEQDSSSFTRPPATSLPGSLGGDSSPTAFTLTGSFLDNVQVDFLLRATQAHQRNRNLLAPHVTVYNGEQAQVAFFTEFNYVGSLIPEVGYGIVGYTIEPSTVNSGIELIITPTISADKRFVSMNVEFFQETVRQFTVFEATTGATGLDNTTDIPIAGVPTTRVQLPELDINELITHVSIPDGGTLLLGGQKLLSEVEMESGVPTLSKIPLLNRLFSNRSTVKDESVLLILIKPKIILQSEEEKEKYGSLLSEHQPELQ